MDTKAIFLTTYISILLLTPIQSYSSSNHIYLSNNTYMPTPIECTNNEDCPNNFYCAKTTCDAPYGYCHPKPQYCIQNYNPVCGCDGHTYPNACEAHAAGVNIDRSEACEGNIKDMCYENTATLDISTGKLIIPMITLKGPGLNGLCFEAIMKWTGKGFVITNARAIPCNKPIPLPEDGEEDKEEP